MRTVIVGGPRTGKTTLARQLGGRLRHTDDLIGTHDWSAASEAASRWLDDPGPWVIEGVAAVRALRKWLERHPTGAPCDQVIALWQPRVHLSPGQRRMLAGCRTVWDEIWGSLRRRGVELR